MKFKKIAILGSTGSIGTQTLELVRDNLDKFGIYGITAFKNWKLLAHQINEFHPRVAVIGDQRHYELVKEAVTYKETELFWGKDAILNLVSDDSVDLVLNGLVGFAGFLPTLRAIKTGKRVALANKESLVVGGELIRQHIGDNENQIIPVDSEHSAIFQCLTGENKDRIEKLVLTASGGPFRSWSLERMKTVTVKQALHHPNWNMGAKITVDSATMMNKGLEVIEARWLFGIPASRIDTIVHPQSVVHSMVTFVDGSTKAQLGPPDMKVPILYALTYPDRIQTDLPRLDWSDIHKLTFEKVDLKRFPCIRLAREALESGGYAPVILNASNEIAVKRFLNEEIGYIDIARVIESCLEKLDISQPLNEETLLEMDSEARRLACTVK